MYDRYCNPDKMTIVFLFLTSSVMTKIFVSIAYCNGLCFPVVKRNTQCFNFSYTLNCIILSSVLVTIRRVLDQLIGFIDTLYTQPATTNDTALSLIYTLSKQLGHAKSSHSSLVVSWQRIYNSLTVTEARY
jgi:hypothetical protein